MKSNDGVFVISVAARLVGMHANTLRKYEKEELLAPARTAGNLRLYSAEDINRLQQIRTLSEEHGINVAGIRLALRVGEEIRRLREEVAEWAGMDDEVRRELIGRLDRVLDELELTVNN
ncbi:MAG TPA: MerR family transcriptional regulator [Chloroflexota bacterium]|nr:MerR family transcriptional regulator [Chloroflexota bacterium]